MTPLRPRARHFRIVVQAFFLLAFLALFWSLAEPRVPGAVASILLALEYENSAAAARVKAAFGIKGFTKTTETSFEHTYNMIEKANINSSSFNFQF